MEGFYYYDKEGVVKMKDPIVFLCSDIKREDAYKLIEWLKDPAIIRYLSDSHNTASQLQQVVENTNLPVLNHLFNHNGQLFMIIDQHKKPIGFMRLINKNAYHEIVIVIGEKSYWHKQYGTKAIKESLRLAFLNLRIKEVVAKIHHDNQFSILAFTKTGFITKQKNERMLTMSLNVNQYLQWQKMLRAKADDIIMTLIDHTRIKALIKVIDDQDAIALKQEIDKAIVVDGQQIQNDVVTMNSVVVVKVDDQIKKGQLTYDRKVDPNAIAITSKLGTALIGYKKGQRLKWQFGNKVADIYIMELLYQPEAAGDYNL